MRHMVRCWCPLQASLQHQVDCLRNTASAKEERDETRVPTSTTSEIVLHPLHFKVRVLFEVAGSWRYLCDTLAVLCLQAFGDSTVLSHVAVGVRQEFLSLLGTEWLRGKRFELLYRDSRDGMTPKAFHDNCDEKGPTLVLIAGQSEGQPVCVFGGYAGKSWSSSVYLFGTHVDARDSFLFSLSNTFGDGLVKMPLNESSACASQAMYCGRNFGPIFGYHTTTGPGYGCSLSVSVVKGLPSGVDAHTAPFGACSYCSPSSAGVFGDPKLRGCNMFTGGQCYVPLELEVWSVCAM
jgi:hypothetical protein